MSWCVLGPTKHMTAADLDRIRKLHDIGCIVTAVYFGIWRHPGDIHHILNESGQRRDDEHQHTICLREWYHRGIPPADRRGRQLTNREAYSLLGPSLFHTKREFVERFGTELELLEMTNALLARIGS